MAMYGSGDLEHRIPQIACNWLYLIYLLYADDKLSYQRSSSPYQDTVAVHQGFPPFFATIRYQLHGPRNTGLLVLIHLMSLPISQQLMAVSSKTALQGEANPV